MITPDSLEYMLNTLEVHKQLQESILRDITRRIMKTDIATDTASWQAEKLQQSGMVYDDIVESISKSTNKSTDEIKTAFENAKTEVFNYDDKTLETANIDPIAFKTISPQMLNIYKSALSKTTTEAVNLTKTTAITSQASYISACDLAHMQVASGAFTYQDAIKNAIVTAAKQGVKVVYPSGWVSSLNTAVRRSVLTGVNQTACKMQEMRADELDVDLMEISAHFGARPTHTEWQGQIVSRTGQKGYLTLDDIGYGAVDGFMGSNCRHTWFMYFDGISKRAYTNQQLDDLKNEKVKYNGEEMPVYDASQKQRVYERYIWQEKSTLVCLDEAIKNATSDEQKNALKIEFNNQTVKLKSHEAKLADFCKQTSLRRDRYREQVFATATENSIKNWGKSVSGKAVATNRYELDKYTKYHYNKDGTIVVTDNWVSKEHPKINKEYKPFAVIETLEIKGGYYQHNRTYYDENGMMCKQVHAGHHALPDKHPFGENGEHLHIYEWYEDKTPKRRSTGEWSSKEKKEDKNLL